jgi:putative SOS response-associated peptidase YedK
MPVILDQDNFDQWLDPANQDTTTLQELLKPYAYSAMSLWPVSKRVNSPANDDPACAQAVEIVPE